MHKAAKFHPIREIYYMIHAEFSTHKCQETIVKIRPKHEENSTSPNLNFWRDFGMDRFERANKFKIEERKRLNFGRLFFRSF